MTVTLVRMTDAEVVEYAASHQAEYIAERVAAGEEPGRARATAERQFAELFPGGHLAGGHRMYRVAEDAEAVGILWIGPHPDRHEGVAWVWDVEIEPEARGRGLGRAAMSLAEEDAVAHGAREISLNVFGHNTVARSLYESLGYATLSVGMQKRLADRAAPQAGSG